MFRFGNSSSASISTATLQAIQKSQAVIEFNMDGTVVTANENFLKVLGYSLGEIQGKHHRMFVEPSERESAAYREFWATLNVGKHQARNTSGSAGKSGFRRRTTRSWTGTASPAASSRSRPTSPR